MASAMRRQLRQTHRLYAPIQLGWVPSHVHISPNEEADESAKKGALLSTPNTPSPQAPFVFWALRH